MEKTTNFQLNQWDKTDRILMEDFNSDNAKLEEAILGRLGPVELIQEVTLESSATELTMDLTGVDWDHWSFVILLWRPICQSTSAKVDFSVTGTGDSPFGGGTGLNDGEQAPGLMVLFPLRDGSRTAWHLLFPYGVLACRDCPFTDITLARLICNTSNGLAAGSWIRLYGIR